MLKEWYRVLKPGGTLRIAVPNFSKMAELYLNKNYDVESFLGLLYGKMEMSGQTIYHKTVYDYKSLSTVLRQSGFNNCTRYDWRETSHSEFDDHSQAYLPHMQKDSGDLMSLNVECKK